MLLYYSLHSNSQLDENIKGVMMRDLFNICGFKLPNHDIITTDNTCMRSVLIKKHYIMFVTIYSKKYSPGFLIFCLSFL